jgi:hypothetical protein
MSALAMTVGDPPHTSALTFSEAGPPPANGAVASDAPGLVTVSLAADLVTWTATLVAGGGPTAGAAPMIANITYTGTSTPPDVGPVQVEPLVITVSPTPVAETGQFNP